MKRAEAPTERRLMLPCDCGCEIVLIAEWPEDVKRDDEWAYVEFFTTYREDGWRTRFKQAWRSLRVKSREPYYHDVVWQRAKLEQLRDWLNDSPYLTRSTAAPEDTG